MRIKVTLLKHGRTLGSLVEQDILRHNRHSEKTSVLDNNPGTFQRELTYPKLPGERDESNPSELELAFFDAAAAGSADVV